MTLGSSQIKSQYRSKKCADLKDKQSRTFSFGHADACLESSEVDVSQFFVFLVDGLLEVCERGGFSAKTCEFPNNENKGHWQCGRTRYRSRGYAESRRTKLATGSLDCQAPPDGDRSFRLLSEDFMYLIKLTAPQSRLLKIWF